MAISLRKKNTETYAMRLVLMLISFRRPSLYCCLLLRLTRAILMASSTSKAECRHDFRSGGRWHSQVYGQTQQIPRRTYSKGRERKGGGSIKDTPRRLCLTTDVLTLSYRNQPANQPTNPSNRPTNQPTMPTNHNHLCFADSGCVGALVYSLLYSSMVAWIGSIGPRTRKTLDPQ